MRKTFLAGLLILAMLYASTGMVFADGSMENFSRDLIYEDQFTDVLETAWYSDHVIAAFEYGLVSGQTDTTYQPDADITVAEALVVACKLHSIYNGMEIGSEEEAPADPWYLPFVDYAVENGIISEDFPYNYASNASRSLFAGIMANALPEAELTAIGTITSIPDVTEATSFSDSIYALYNAGILKGSDEYGTFHPYDTIRRSEVAVVALNLAEQDRREAAELKEIPTFTLYSDYGTTVTVREGTETNYLKLGWSTSPVSVASDSGAEAILNAATLNPMKTNNAELDNIIDGIFADIISDDMSTYQKTKAIYDYLMDNCYYGWGAVSWSGKYVKHDDDYVVVMGKHILKTGHGTCDNYSAAFVAMARRIGLNAFFARGYAGNQSGYMDTHEIAIVSIGGVDYVFDPQIEDFNSRPGSRTYSLFCKPFSSMTGRYKGYNLNNAKTGFGNFELK